MQLQAIFVYDRFAEKVADLLTDTPVVIPQNIIMRMGVFFAKFALGHKETPTVDFRGQTGYFNDTPFLHRGTPYHLHFALILCHENWDIQLTIYTHGRAIIDTTFSADPLLTLSSRTLPITSQVHSTIESIKQDLHHLYYRIAQNEPLLEEAIKEACLRHTSQFKNHINGVVKLTYYNEVFNVYDRSLKCNRFFHLPAPYAKLCHPVLTDYLLLDTAHRYHFEPTFNNADTYKVVGTKKELFRAIKEDFRLSMCLPRILRQLLRQERYLFKDAVEFKVGSYDKPVITITRQKPSSYKKIHYIINNTIIKSLAEI